MTVGVAHVRADLIAEQDALDDALSSLDPSAWATPTVSPRWSIADQIGHLAFFDRTAALAITDPDAFRVHVGELLATLGDELATDQAVLGKFREMPPPELLETWRANRARLAKASELLEDDTRVIWYGPSMGAKSFLTARLMECWAHGQDAVDAAGVQREATDRLEHIARLGFMTRGWSYVNRGMEIPNVEVGVRLTSPSGAEWSFGPEGTAERVSGPAEDFCLVITQRRHVDDTNLVVEGAAARDWMLKAQVFAGPATDGPEPN